MSCGSAPDAGEALLDASASGPFAPTVRNRRRTASPSDPRGSSSNASGFPRVSATIRSRTRSSSLNGTAERSSARASPFDQAAAPRAPAAARAPRPARAPRTRSHRLRLQATGDERERPRRGWSSHCASSTTHSSGRSSAVSESRLSAARATRNRSGARAGAEPEHDLSASRCGAGSRSRPVEQRHTQLVQAGKRKLHLRLDAHRPNDRQVRGRFDQVLQQRRLPDPASRRTPATGSRPVRSPRPDRRVPRIRQPVRGGSRVAPLREQGAPSIAMHARSGAAVFTRACRPRWCRIADPAAYRWSYGRLRAGGQPCSFGRFPALRAGAQTTFHGLTKPEDH